MQNANKISIVVNLFLIVLFAAATPAFACLCKPTSSTERVRIMKKEAEVILVGTVTEVARENPFGTGRDMRVTIQPEKIWKSPLPLSEEYAIFTSGGCAVGFQIGSSYLVYAALENERLITEICFGTGLTEFSKKDVKKLGKPIKTVKKDKTRSFFDQDTYQFWTTTTFRSVTASYASKWFLEY